MFFFNKVLKSIFIFPVLFLVFLTVQSVAFGDEPELCQKKELTAEEYREYVKGRTVNTSGLERVWRGMMFLKYLDSSVDGLEVNHDGFFVDPSSGVKFAYDHDGNDGDVFMANTPQIVFSMGVENCENEGEECTDPQYVSGALNSFCDMLQKQKKFFNDIEGEFSAIKDEFDGGENLSEVMEEHEKMFLEEHKEVLSEYGVKPGKWPVEMIELLIDDFVSKASKGDFGEECKRWRMMAKGRHSVLLKEKVYFDEHGFDIDKAPVEAQKLFLEDNLLKVFKGEFGEEFKQLVVRVISLGARVFSDVVARDDFMIRYLAEKDESIQELVVYLFSGIGIYKGLEFDGFFVCAVLFKPFIFWIEKSSSQDDKKKAYDAYERFYRSMIVTGEVSVLDDLSLLGAINHLRSIRKVVHDEIDDQSYKTRADNMLLDILLGDYIEVANLSKIDDVIEMIQILKEMQEVIPDSDGMHQKISNRIAGLSERKRSLDLKSLRQEFNKEFEEKTPEEKQKFVDSLYSSEERIEVFNALEPSMDRGLFLAVIEHASDQNHKIVAFDRVDKDKIFSDWDVSNRNHEVRDFIRMVHSHINDQDIKDRATDLLFKNVDAINAIDAIEVIKLLSEIRDAT